MEDELPQSRPRPPYARSLVICHTPVASSNDKEGAPPPPGTPGDYHWGSDWYDWTKYPAMRNDQRQQDATAAATTDGPAATATPDDAAVLLAAQQPEQAEQP